MIKPEMSIEELRKFKYPNLAAEIMEIYDELIANPELIDFMKFCMSLTKKQREMVLEMLKEKQGAE